MFDTVSISSLSVIIPALAGVLLYARLPKPARIITWLLCVYAVAEAIAHFALRLNGLTNWWVYFAVTIAEFALVTMFYKSIFRHEYARKVIVWLAWLGWVVTFGEYGILHEPMGPISMLYSCTFYFAMSLWAFYEIVMLEAPEDFVWINVSIMLLFLGSAGFFSSWYFMKADLHLFKLFTHVHAYLLLVCYLTFTIGLWRSRQSSY